MGSRVNVAERNKSVLEDLDIDDIMNAELSEERREQLLRRKKSRKGQLEGTACGLIMMTATAIALILLFTSPMVAGGDWSREAMKEAARSVPFWIPWPIGGIGCGIACLAIEGLVKDE